MEIEIKTNKPFEYEDVDVIFSIDITEGREPTVQMFAVYKVSEVRKMLLEYFEGAVEGASVHVDKLLKTGRDVVKMGTTTKFFTYTRCNIKTKKMNEISEKTKQILRSKGWEGTFKIEDVVYINYKAGYWTPSYLCVDRENGYAFQVYQLGDEENDNELKYDSILDGCIYETLEDAFYAGVNFVVREYIDKGDFDLSNL